MILGKPEILYLGDAKGGTKLTSTPKNATRAASLVSKVKIRDAGGSYVGNSGLSEFVKDIGTEQYEVVKTIAQYTTVPGLVYTVYDAGKSTKSQIETRIATDPQFKQNVQTVLDKVKNVSSDIIDTVTGPIVGTSKLISWLPYIAVGTLVTFAIFAFRNPGSVSTPRKVSLY